MTKLIYRISVGIAAYNEAANIKQAVESVLKQRGNNFILADIIIADDAGTDGTVELVKSFNNKKIKLVQGKIRRGQNFRQNQILKLMDENSDGLLRLEADTCLKDSNHITRLVEAIPEDSRYSVIVSQYEPVVSGGWFSRVLAAGFALKQEIFNKVLSWPNLYLFKIGLLSKEFLSRFTWDNNFQEDSYCYRQALESHLPIIKSPAVINFKLVENLRDYLWQSGKFQKAKQLESGYSPIYQLSVSRAACLKIILKHWLNHPVSISCYLLLVFLGRMYQLFLPKFSPFWKIYSSSKKLTYA